MEMSEISPRRPEKLSIFERDTGVKEYLLIDKTKRRKPKDIIRKA
jgi:hypothetical protein